KKDFSFSYVIDTIAPLPPTVSLEDYVVLPNGIILSGNDLPALTGIPVQEKQSALINVAFSSKTALRGFYIRALSSKVILHIITF
ncbi:hypothetical protein MJI47_28220, partial [Salmonella enterica subsp. enterica serovar Kentucky]|nr:hypothetical protein [Salmonella enterica subsp. enterica serovar Kentucky]